MTREVHKASREEKLLAVGIVIKPHGIKGALVVEVMSDCPERFEPGSELILRNSESLRKTVFIKTSYSYKGNVVLTLTGVENREDAELVRNNLLLIPESKASKLKDDEYWIHDLVGMKVTGEEGEELGVVDEVLCGGAQDILNIVGREGEYFQVPFVKAFIMNVDSADRNITVKLIKGMIPRNED